MRLLAAQNTLTRNAFRLDSLAVPALTTQAGAIQVPLAWTAMLENTAALGPTVACLARLENTHQLQLPTLALTVLLVDTVLPLEQHHQTLAKQSF